MAVVATHIDGSNATPAVLNVGAVSPSDGSNRAMYVPVMFSASSSADADAVAVTWRPVNVGSATNEQAFTRIGQTGAGTGTRIQLYRLLAPNSSESVDARIRLDLPNVFIQSSAAWYLRDVDQASPNGTVATNTSSGTASSLSVGGSGLNLNAAGYWVSSGVDTPAAGGGQTADGSRTDSTVFNESAIGFGHGSASPTWSSGSSRSWHAIGVAVTAA